MTATLSWPISEFSTAPPGAKSTSVPHWPEQSMGYGQSHACALLPWHIDIEEASTSWDVTRSGLANCNGLYTLYPGYRIVIYGTHISDK